MTCVGRTHMGARGAWSRVAHVSLISIQLRSVSGEWTVESTHTAVLRSHTSADGLLVLRPRTRGRL